MELQRDFEVGYEEQEGGGFILGSQLVFFLYLGRVYWWVYFFRILGVKYWILEEQWFFIWGFFLFYVLGIGYVLLVFVVQFVLKVVSRVFFLLLEDVFVGVSVRRGGFILIYCVKLVGVIYYFLDRCCYGRFLLIFYRLDFWKM